MHEFLGFSIKVSCFYSWSCKVVLTGTLCLISCLWYTIVFLLCCFAYILVRDCLPPRFTMERLWTACLGMRLTMKLDLKLLSSFNFLLSVPWDICCIDCEIWSSFRFLFLVAGALGSGIPFESFVEVYRLSSLTASISISTSLGLTLYLVASKKSSSLWMSLAKLALKSIYYFFSISFLILLIPF